MKTAATLNEIFRHEEYEDPMIAIVSDFIQKVFKAKSGHDKDATPPFNIQENSLDSKISSGAHSRNYKPDA